MVNNYSIIVNTCDTYDDCWYPFFKLFTKYWPDCTAHIYLNTEHKEYHHDGLNIISTKACAGKLTAQRLTWSECLINALEMIESEVVLYLQEDYFLKADVKNEIINGYVALMSQDTTIDCIHLTDQAVEIDTIQTKYDGLFTVSEVQPFRVSCQAALWRKEVLLSILQKHESAWQFEKYASKRSRYMNHKFYAVDPSKVILDEFEIIPYVFTGIFQGRWMEHVQPLFENHNIEIDYTKRGFFLEAPPLSLKTKLIKFWHRLPAIIRSKSHLLIMRFTHNS